MNEKEIKIAADFIRGKLKSVPKIAVVLGSGLGNLAERLSDSVTVKYEDIPGFPVSTVKGHSGAFVCGRLNGRLVLMMKGRVHFYEGYSIQKVVLPVYMMAELGIKTLLLTNAAGGIGESVSGGDLMAITDHLGFNLDNPLIGLQNEYTERFPDMSEVYRKSLTSLLEESAKENKVDLKKGIYVYSTGPTYETPAEVRAYQMLGASAVGMSTVPEALVANACGISVAAVSCITNMAAGMQKGKLNHQEVVETAAAVNDKFCSLVTGFISRVD